MLGMISLEGQSEEDYLIVPDGSYEESILSKYKLERTLTREFKNISKNVSKVYDITLFENWFDWLGDHIELGTHRDFSISFTVETTSGAVYENIQCGVFLGRRPGFFKYKMGLLDCRNDQVHLGSDRVINVLLKSRYDNVFIEEHYTPPSRFLPPQE